MHGDDLAITICCILVVVRAACMSACVPGAWKSSSWLCQRPTTRHPVPPSGSFLHSTRVAQHQTSRQVAPVATALPSQHCWGELLTEPRHWTSSARPWAPAMTAARLAAKSASRQAAWVGALVGLLPLPLFVPAGVWARCALPDEMHLQMGSVCAVAEPGTVMLIIGVPATMHQLSLRRGPTTGPHPGSVNTFSASSPDASSVPAWRVAEPGSDATHTLAIIKPPSSRTARLPGPRLPL